MTASLVTWTQPTLPLLACRGALCPVTSALEERHVGTFCVWAVCSYRPGGGCQQLFPPPGDMPTTDHSRRASAGGVLGYRSGYLKVAGNDS